MVAQKTYIKNSFELKDALIGIGHLSSNTSNFTYDVVGMYPSIDIEECIPTLTTFFRLSSTQKKFSHFAPEPLIKAIKIDIQNNRIWFGDVTLYIKLLRL